MNATRCRMHNGHGSSSRLRCEKIANASSDEHASVPNTNRSEEHTSELQSLMRISYAVFCLKKKKNTNQLQQQPNNTDNTKTYQTPHTKQQNDTKQRQESK